MGVGTYDELAAHYGHRLACVYYGARRANVAVECEDCGTILVDFDRDPDPPLMGCNTCGYEIRPSDLACPNCGLARSKALGTR